MLILISKLWFLLITILTAIIAVGFLYDGPWLGVLPFACFSIYARKIYLDLSDYKETPDLPNPPAGGVGGEEE